jgi:outer membrane protein
MRLNARIAPIVALLVGFFFGSVGTTVAQDLQIGFTDPNMIVAQMPEYQDVLEEMQSTYQSGQQEYQALIKKYQASLEDYQDKQALMSEATRKKREAELTQMQQKIQQFLSQKQQEMGQREAELIQPLLEKVQGAIDQVAEEQNLDLVLSTQAGNSSVILYAANDEMDITAEVMSELGMQPPPEGSTSPTGAGSPNASSGP